MGIKGPIVGSKHDEALDGVAEVIELRDYEVEYGQGNVGRCFVTGSQMWDLKMDKTIRVTSEDSRGRPVIEKYRISSAGFHVLVRRNGPQYHWHGRSF